VSSRKIDAKKTGEPEILQFLDGESTNDRVSFIVETPFGRIAFYTNCNQPG